ncbi:MAG: hypothetical protein HN374_00255 [Cryomorphaceae bacterium]|nr:hypothetical protein [Cryomorphaceae bacterium]
MDQNIPKLYYEYGKYVNQSRQFPLSTDGLKPVERRVLLSAYLLTRNKFVKSARIDGHTIGNFHPHGSCYGTCVQLVHQGFLIGQGNFGSNVGCDPSPPAASRYTEVKLHDKVIDLAFKNIDHVKWEMNDLGEKEPLYLPSMFPLCLLGTKYTEGIGFGYKTFIPCYKIEDLKERLLWLLGKSEVEPIIKPISNCKITATDNVLKELLTTGKAKIETEGIVRASPRNHSVSLKSWPFGRKFETFLSKFSKELESQDISWIDLSSEETNIKFEVLKQRNKDIIYKKFIAKLREAIKGSISFESIVVDLDDKVQLKSIDDLLVETYEMFTAINKKVLQFKILKIQENIDELKILAKIKPFLSQVLIPNLNVDRAIKILAQKSGVEEKKIKHLFSKYKINKLLTVSSDTSQIVAEQNVHKSNLNNLEEFVIKQYEEI